MKILFYGDSITDMNRFRDHEDGTVYSYGVGYPNFIVGELSYEEPTKYQFINRGISGNRIVDLYARVKIDAWNHKPDVLSILIGVNDVWHEISRENGVELPRWERFLAVKEYAKVAKKIAEDYGAYFVPLQEKFDEATKDCGTEPYLFDGVHPTAAGAKLIATEWLKVFDKIKELII